MIEAEWNDLIQRFDDSTIYQTWQYGAVRWGEENLSNIVLRKEGEVRAIAQLRVLKLPLVRAGVGYLFRGPLWHRRGREADTEDFRQMLRTLRLFHVKDKRFLLKVIPNEAEDSNGTLRTILEEEGFARQNLLRPYRTFNVDLALSSDDLFRNLQKRWRNRLKKALDCNFEIVEGAEDALYLEFAQLYWAMYQRKRFVRFVDIEEFREIQQRLPESLKMRIMVLKYEGEPVAAGVWSVLGNTAVGIFSATSEKALELKGGYALKWNQIAWLQERGFRYFDLGGVDLHDAPGPYAFKAGLAGKSASEICHLGTFESCESPLSQHLIGAAEAAQLVYRRSKLTWNKALHLLKKWAADAGHGRS